jgi:hypothetical protein
MENGCWRFLRFRYLRIMLGRFILVKLIAIVIVAHHSDIEHVLRDLILKGLRILRRTRKVSCSWCDIAVLLIFIFLLEITSIFFRAFIWAIVTIFLNFRKSHILNWPFSHHIRLICSCVVIIATSSAIRTVYIDCYLCLWVLNSIQLRFHGSFRVCLLALLWIWIGHDFFRGLHERRFLQAILVIHSLAFLLPLIPHLQLLLKLMQ